MAITGRDNYFENFSVGDIYDHVRGRTVTNWDNYALTHLSMNTASAHFDLVLSEGVLDGKFRERLVAGPCTLNIIVAGYKIDHLGAEFFGQFLNHLFFVVNIS